MFEAKWPTAPGSSGSWARAPSPRDEQVTRSSFYPTESTGYLAGVSPTVLRVRGYRFYFFSREESRPHVHVQHATGEAKIWLEPGLAVAQNHGLSPARLATAVRLVEEHHNEIRAAWKAHFGR